MVTIYSLVVSFPNFEQVHCSMFGSNCCFLTCIQVSQEAGNVAGIPTSSNISKFVVIHTVKGFHVVTGAEDAFLKFPCFLYDPLNVGNLISGSSAISKPSLYIWKFLIQTLLKPGLKDFEHNITGVQNRHSGMVWTFNGIALLSDWNENWLIRLVATAEFSKFAEILSAAHQETHLFASQVVSKSLLRTKIE